MSPLFIVAALLYFVPSVCALLRGIKTPQGPVLLNLFLGWTILGWVAALIWAACAPLKPSLAHVPNTRGALWQLGRCVGYVRNSFRTSAKS